MSRVKEISKYLAAGLAGAGALYLIQTRQPEPSNASPSPTLVPYFEPSKDVLVVPKTRELSRQLIDRYLNAKTQLEEVIQRPLTIDETRLGTFAADKMNRLAWQNVIDGAYLAKTIGLGSVQISGDNQQISLRGRYFELQNPIHFQLASSILTLELRGKSYEFQKQSIQEQESQSAKADPAKYAAYSLKQRLRDVDYLQENDQKTIQNLFWLYDKNPPIVVEQDAFTFLPTEHIDNLARLLRASQETGLPFPQKITYIRYKKGDPGAAWYFGHNSGDKAFSVEITNNSSTDSIVHEYGHFLSDAYHADQDNTRIRYISQQRFEEVVNTALARNGAGIKDVRNAFLVVKDSGPDLVEEYAQRFKQFFLEGSDMRAKLYKLQRSDPAAYETVKVMYDFMKTVWSGREFTENGEELERKYAIGNTVLIKDEDTQRPGILLKPAIDSQPDPNFPSVFNRDYVKIIEGPVIVDNDFFGKSQQKTFWRVSINNQSDESYSKTGFQYDKTGWISDEYLGESLKPGG